MILASQTELDFPQIFAFENSISIVRFFSVPEYFQSSLCDIYAVFVRRNQFPGVKIHIVLFYLLKSPTALEL